MSWFRTALSITTVYPDSYYTAVDIGEFYEWKFNGYIPESKIFTKKLPPSDVFSNGMIIATARLDSNVLEPQPFGFKTKEKIHTDINIQAGQIQTPQEIINKYKDLTHKFAVSLSNFQQSIFVRPYFANNEHLYRIGKAESGRAQFYSYGKIQDILDKLSAKKKSLSDASLKKSGRSHEMEDFRRFENAMTTIGNQNLPINTSAIDTVLNISDIQPTETYEMSWNDCFTKVSAEAKSFQDLIHRFESLSWVKTALSMQTKTKDIR